MNNTLEQVRALAAQHGDALALVVNVSGGKDSTRLLGYIREELPHVKTYVVYADTGFEHVKPVSAEEWARQRAAAYGLPLAVVRNPNKTYLEMVAGRKKFPSASNRQCTSDLKRDPVAKFIRHLGERVIPARAKQTPWKRDERLSKAGREVFNWMPIFGLSLREVIEWHWSTGTPLHPVYIPAYHADGTQGGYLRRFSCRVCIFSTDADIRAIYHHDRDAFNMVSDLEESTGFTMKNGKTLVQIAGTVSADNRQYGSEEFLEVASTPCI